MAAAMNLLVNEDLTLNVIEIEEAVLFGFDRSHSFKIKPDDRDFHVDAPAVASAADSRASAGELAGSLSDRFDLFYLRGSKCLERVVMREHPK